MGRNRTEPSKAKVAALRALELDPTRVEAHVALARIAIHRDWNWEAADRELGRALELDPVNPEAHRVSATLLYVKGRVDEAIERCKAALELDPLSPVLNDHLISAYAAARRYDETIALCRRTLEMFPDRTYTRYWLGYAYLGKGAHAEAIAELERVVATPGGGSAGGCPFGTVALARAYALSGRADEARSLMPQCGQIPSGQGATHANPKMCEMWRRVVGKRRPVCSSAYLVPSGRDQVSDA